MTASGESRTNFDRQAIFSGLVSILEDMTSDWEVDVDGGIDEASQLIADLGFESVDVVQLVVAIEEHFQRRDIPFEELLMEDGQYVEELRVGQIVDFLTRHLAAA